MDPTKIKPLHGQVLMERRVRDAWRWKAGIGKSDNYGPAPHARGIL